MIKHRNKRRLWPLPWLLLICAALGCRALTGRGNKADARSGPAFQTQLDVVYGEADGQKLLMDITMRGPSAGIKPRPAILFVHGGGWSGGDKRDFSQLAEGSANAGYVCFNINYRLAKPEGNKYPAQLDDCQRAVRWIRANAAKYNVDPQRIGALGASAGGHLVALLGTMDTRDNSDKALAAYSSRVTCVVDMFGPTDFMVGLGQDQKPEVPQLVYNLFGKTREEAPQLYRDASPLYHIDKKTVPFLIFHGTVDPLVPIDQSQRFYAALKKAGIEATFTIFEGEGHGFQKKENIDRFVTETLAFFNKHLG